ncbi:probable low-specificity L-threonine aldolase 2 [Ornithorhynchus anatinus]|uniref:Aromatic amino acid beta-eliminating lyase/threonine aldolase domain-containing protein n=1 Tax=Ornithorhynchus anatinus TaxID=9258 RepID=A0A6I8PDH3_ORNAN|nr:probable low-specificity L-threonine aldolase 2 [Ornithorhynchus anatinus]
MLGVLAQAWARGSGPLWRAGVRRRCQGAGTQGDPPPRVVDLRSDTVTRPGPEMRRAMAQAVVGDDDYGEDPTVQELQYRAAELLGVERTLFVPTNTMANLIAVMCHCPRRGSQLLLGQESHLHVYEQGGVAQIAGVHSHPLPDLPRGTLDLDELERKVRQGHGSPYHPRCELVCLENTHNSAGGRALPLAHLLEVRLLAERYGFRVHLDGARLVNAAVALGVPPARLVQPCDSVSLCLSKGLGAPVGALVGGRRDFVEEAWRIRKALGGGMRQAGVLAAAALVGLMGSENVLAQDHRNARRFAQGLQELASPLCAVDPDAVETNMVLVHLSPGLLPETLCQRLAEVGQGEEGQLGGAAVRVLVFPWTARSVRAVWHRDVSAEDTELALRKWDLVLRRIREEGGEGGG